MLLFSILRRELNSFLASFLFALFLRSIASVIWRPIFTIGLREDNGSWKIIDILSPLILYISSSVMDNKSFPSYRISPPSIIELPARIPRIALEVTDLPEPDSPTIASVLPLSRSNEISLTALTVPPCVRKETFRFLTSNILSIYYSSTPRSDGLNASLNPLPNKLKHIISNESTNAGHIIR